MNVSIISACNNNCEYCFQKDYHKENKMLTLEELDEIFNWGRFEERIGLLGGEPTLHPDIIEIVKRARKVSHVCVFTNLLCKTELLDELSDIVDISYLVNTTSRDDLKDLFYKNAELLYSKIDYLKKNHISFSFGLTLMNNEEIDNKNIENLFNLVAKFPDLTSHIRMGLATPFHEGTFELMNYGAPVQYMIEKTLKEFPNMTIGFDCPSNNCQIPPKLMGNILEEPRVDGFKFGCSGAIFDVLVDKSLKYCFSFPDDFMRVDTYTRFKDSREARMWFDSKISGYMCKNAYQCKKNKKCNNLICKGACPAVNEYLRRQNYKNS